MIKRLLINVFLLVFSHLCIQVTSASVTYKDITQSCGIDFVHSSGNPTDKTCIIEAKGGGLALFDADGDGWLDIYFVNGNHLENKPQPVNKLYRNNQDGTFTNITQSAGVGDNSWSMGCAAADYDNDGDVDFYVTNHGPNKFFRNNGDGTFTDIIVDAGCQSNLLSTGVAFGDYDLDGWVDLVVADYLDLKSIQRKPGEPEKSADWRGFNVYPGPRAYQAQGMSLFHNKGNGTFENVTQTSGLMNVPAAYSFTCLWADINNDRYPDLYVSNDSMPSYLYISNGNGKFEETGLVAGVSYSEDGTEMASMGADYGDANADFEWDLVVTNFSEEPFSVLYGTGDGFFDNETYTSGVGHTTYTSLGWGTHWIDFDSDGDDDLFFNNGHVYPEADHSDLDISFAQSPQMYVNNNNGKFTMTKNLGKDFYSPRVGRGSAIGDIDRDGDLDIVLNNLNGKAAVLRNDSANQNNWLQLQLHGTNSNRSAIGTVVKCKSGHWKAMKGVWSGSSFLSQSSFDVHLGLGKLDSVEEIIIEWTSGRKAVLHNVKANQRLSITEE